MDKLIKEIESDPFSNNDIYEICDNKTKIIKYSELFDYNNIDEVLQPFDNIVILYESEQGYGHWICLLKYDNTIEFFDPYGLGIDEQFSFVNKNTNNKLGQTFKILSKLLVDSPYKLIENNYKFQKMYQNVSTCGRHVSVRIILRHVPLHTYINIMKGNKIDPDLIVTYLTSFFK